MQTVKLNIADDMLNKFMDLIQALPQGSVVIEEVAEKTNEAQANDPYFEDRKAMIQQRIDDIDSGKSIMGSFEEFEKEMDEFEKELESKYAN